MKKVFLAAVITIAPVSFALAGAPDKEQPPAKAMDSATPEMKNPGGTKDLLPAQKAMDEAAPAIKPSDTATPAQPSDASPASPSGLTLTEAEAKKWIGKTIYSSDNKNVGEVTDLKRDADGKVLELHADIGGFLGIGETRVKVLPDQFQVGADRITLNVTGEAAGKLPKVEASAQ